MVRRLLLICAMLGVWLGAPAPAGAATQTVQCDRQIVRVGDPIWRVARRCPEPFWVEQWRQPLGHGRFGHHHHGFHGDLVEVWYLNFGKRRLMRQLIFRNGNLAHVRTLDYGVGFTPGTRRCTARQLENAGNTIGEIYARCGAPDYRFDFDASIGPYYGGPWPLPAGAQRERWTYDFGSRRLVRELFFINGRLIHIRTEQP